MLFASSASGSVMYWRRFTTLESFAPSGGGPGSSSLVFSPRRDRSIFNAHFAASESDPASAASFSTSPSLMLPYSRDRRQRSFSKSGIVKNIRDTGLESNQNADQCNRTRSNSKRAVSGATRARSSRVFRRFVDFFPRVSAGMALPGNVLKRNRKANPKRGVRQTLHQPSKRNVKRLAVRAAGLPILPYASDNKCLQPILVQQLRRVGILWSDPKFDAAQRIRPQ